MRTPLCPNCGVAMKKNGTTSSGRTRWRCKDGSCGVSATRRYGRQPPSPAATRHTRHCSQTQADVLRLLLEYNTFISMNAINSKRSIRIPDADPFRSGLSQSAAMQLFSHAFCIRTNRGRGDVQVSGYFVLIISTDGKFQNLYFTGGREPANVQDAATIGVRPLDCCRNLWYRMAGPHPKIGEGCFFPGQADEPLSLFHWY